MRLALGGDRQPGPRQPRNGNRIWLISCIVTVLVVVVVAVKVTGSSCPGQPGVGGAAVAAGGAGPDGRAGPGRRTAGPLAAAPLAARPALATSLIGGRAVFYDPGQAAGSCGLGPFPARGWYASLPPRGYASGRACGSYLDVYGPGGTVRAEVVDVCPDCAAGTVNLSRAAFARIADPGTGTVAVSYRTAVDPPLPGPLVLRIAAAAPPRTLSVQVINHGNRLSSVAASRPGGPWRRLVPSADGYWTGPLRPGRTRGTPVAAGPAGGRIRVRIADAEGHRVVLTAISPGSTVLHTATWMYRPRDRGASGASVAPATAASPGRRTGPAALTGSC